MNHEGLIIIGVQIGVLIVTFIMMKYTEKQNDRLIKEIRKSNQAFFDACKDLKDDQGEGWKK